MKRVNVVIVALLLVISMTGCGDDIESAYLWLNGGNASTDSTLQGSVVVPGPEEPVFVEGESIEDKPEEMEDVTDAEVSPDSGAEDIGEIVEEIGEVAEEAEAIIAALL